MSWTTAQREEFMRHMAALFGDKFWGADEEAEKVKVRIWEQTLYRHPYQAVLEAAEAFNRMSDKWPNSAQRLVALLPGQKSPVDAFGEWVAPYVGRYLKLAWTGLPEGWSEPRKAELRKRGRWARLYPTGFEVESIRDRQQIRVFVPFAGRHPETTETGADDEVGILANQRWREAVQREIVNQLGEPADQPRIPDPEENTWDQYRQAVKSGELERPRLFGGDRSPHWLDGLLEEEDPSLYLTGLACPAPMGELPSRFFGEQWRIPEAPEAARDWRPTHYDGELHCGAPGSRRTKARRAVTCPDCLENLRKHDARAIQLAQAKRAEAARKPVGAAGREPGEDPEEVWS